MRELERDIRSFLRNEAHIQGIAAVNHLSSGSKLGAPKSMLKGTNSIICYGVQIPKGLIYAEKNDLALYWRYCNMQYRVLDTISNKLSTFLEDREGLAVPIYSCFPWMIKNREFWGSLPLVYWAEEAGLGRISKCGLLITRQCGTRILLGAVLTTLKLKPNEKLSDDICPPECFKCVDICPAKAIKRTGKVDHNSCIRYSSSNPLLKLVLDNKTTRENYSFETIINTVAIDDHGAYLCFECMKACPLNRM